MLGPNPFIRISSALASLCLLLIAASVCHAQFFTLPGSFSYSLNSVNQVFDVTADGKMAVALRNDTGFVHNALLTSFNPISGTPFDSKTFGFGPLGVQLAQTPAGLRAVVLTSEGGPNTIYIFDVSPTGQLTQLSTTRLTNSGADARSNLVLSASAQVGFIIVVPSTGPGMRLVTFSLADGAVLNSLAIAGGGDTLRMIETPSQRKLAFLRDLSTLEIVDAIDPIHPTVSGDVALPRNSAFSAVPTPGIAFSGDARYVFVANGFIDLSAVDLSTNQVIASIGGKYSFGRIKIHENSQRRLLAVHSDTSDTGAGSGTILLVDATNPASLSIVNQYSFTSGYKSDLAFSQTGSQLFLANSNTLLAVDVPSFSKIWERRATNSFGREHQVMTYGQPEEVLSAWEVSGGLGFISMFGSFPAVFPDISVNDVTVTEGNTGQVSASFNVSLSAPTTHRVTLNYATAEGTAAQGSDFATVSGTLTLEPGETSRTISVPVLGDSLDEFDETFTLNLSNPTVGNLVRSIGTCTILDDDPPPGISISDASTIEGDSGNAIASFAASLSAPSGKTITVNYATADNTALAASDYLAASGSLVFSPGQTTRTINVAVKGDKNNEPDESFFINLSNPINVIITDEQAIATIINDDTPTLQLDHASYNLQEGTGSLDLLVNRSGDPSLPVTVNYTTSDAANFLQNCNVVNGAATSRCDYVGVLGTLHFASGETSKTISIPIVDDTYVEGTENFFISLSNPAGGAVIGTNQRATITITDNSNDVSGIANPIDDKNFFVRQHYIDFLSREPDPLSAGWITILNQCGAGDQSCRLTVSQGIYGSPEFRDRGYFIYKFYSVSLGRKPSYDEFNLDRARVSGFQTEAELEQSKVDFINDFMARTEFANIYNGLTDNAYVQRLYDTAGVTQVTVNGVVLNVAQMQQSMNTGKTRAQVLREVAESAEVSARFLTESTVVMHYFGYLRRDPDAAYQGWINILNSTGDSRNVTSGFINSPEYRARFGQ